MRFGSSIPDPVSWHRWFAWFPVKTMDRRVVWLEVVERISYFAREIPCGAARGPGFRWCYRVLDQ